MSTAGHVRMLVMLVVFLLVLTVASIILSIVIMVQKRDKSDDYHDNSPGGHYRDWEKHVTINNYHRGEGEGGYYGGEGEGEGGYHGGEGEGEGFYDDKIWLIGMSGTWGTFARLADDNDGAINGWSKAVVEAACHAANIKCRVVYSSYKQCFVTPSKYIELGPCLAFNEFDAWSAMFPTEERKNVAIFSKGYLTAAEYNVWYHGSYPVGSASSLRVGYRYKTPGDDKCFRRYLTRLGISGQPTFVGFPVATLSIQALVDNEIDLLFEAVRYNVLSQHPEVPNLKVYDLDGDGDTSLDHPNNYMVCSGPAGLAAKKDKGGLIHAFNEGLEEIMCNGVYQEICDRADFNSGPTSEHRTWCLPTCTEGV